VKLACNAGSEVCLSDAHAKLLAYINGLESIPKDLEEVIICNGLRGVGKRTEWNFIYGKLHDSADSIFRSSVIKGLGCSDDSYLMATFLETIVGDAEYSEVERQAVLKSVLKSSSGHAAILSFLSIYESVSLQKLGYSNLESLLMEVAAETKTEAQQSILTGSFSTFSSLSTAAALRLTSIVDSNMEKQQETKYQRLMNEIQIIVAPFVPSTEAPETTTAGAQTTISVEQSTVGVEQTTVAEEQTTIAAEQTTTDVAFRIEACFALIISLICVALKLN